MNVKQWWQWWHNLSHNPIYQRERGGWGKANPFYDNLSRFSPFVVLGAILLGVCAAFSNPAMLAGNEGLIGFGLLICLPAFLLSTLTLFSTFMAPALTAPLISMEMDRGTWEILRLTPYSTRSILLTKLIGAMGRLRIWPALFILSALQALAIACSFTLAIQEMILWGWLIGLAVMLRPFLEILFAGMVGLYLSTSVRSATIALVGSYTAVIVMKLVNGNLLWAWLVSSFLEGADKEWPTQVVSIGVGPTVVYLLAVFLVGLGLMRQADLLDRGDIVARDTQ